MLLDSNILIYGAEGGEPLLDAILDRTDLAVASVTCIETLGFHRLGETERAELESAISQMKIMPLDDSVMQKAIALRQLSRMGLGGCDHCRDRTGAWSSAGDPQRGRL